MAPEGDRLRLARASAAGDDVSSAGSLVLGFRAVLGSIVQPSGMLVFGQATVLD